MDVIKTLQEEHPEKVIISTEGPVGLMVMVAAKLLSIPVEVICHTDYLGMARAKLADGGKAWIPSINTILRGFHSMGDRILYFTEAHKNRLLDTGYPKEKLKKFPRGVNLETYRPASTAVVIQIKRTLPHPEAPVFLVAGRLSKEKNLPFLEKVMKNFQRSVGDQPFNLIFAGDGPDRANSKLSRKRHFILIKTLFFSLIVVHVEIERRLLEKNEEMRAHCSSK
jgi:glycosyltransferase involved in cell wall biosynthesis